MRGLFYFFCAADASGWVYGFLSFLEFFYLERRVVTKGLWALVSFLWRALSAATALLAGALVPFLLASKMVAFCLARFS